MTAVTFIIAIVIDMAVIAGAGGFGVRRGWKSLCNLCDSSKGLEARGQYLY